ncbi:MAG: uroporphyrinogen-III C-methyltransferase [Candidatus Phaeomarinobacter sp.]
MSSKRFKPGGVALVGAGPGDPELLTLKAVRKLDEADVVLFDSLVTPDVLALARRGAARICVGKRAGRPSCKQEDINALMVQLASTGKNVVRLKSGDPSIFGRSGEEIKTLEEGGIDVTIVPGITTASALAAELKTSLTHREHAQSVRFITAHGAKGGLPEGMDWVGLADPAMTLIVYMGARTSRTLAQGLIKAGRQGTTPAMVSENVSRRNARHTRSTLADLAAGLVAMDTSRPVLISIGEVFGYRSTAAHRDTAPAAPLEQIAR